MIAIVYTDEIDVVALAVALGFFAALFALRWAGPWRTPIAAIVGVGMWVALLESGIDPVISGLVVGLVTSAYPPARDDLERSTELTRSFREQPTPELAYTARASLTSAISLNERLQYRLLPWTSKVVVPLFAVANAGILFSSVPAVGRAHLAGHAGHRGGLCHRQAGGHPRRGMAGNAQDARGRGG